jgi:hypothetical protein
MDNKVVLNYVCAQVGGIPRSRIVKFGLNDTEMVLSTSSNDNLMGVTTEVTAVQGERMDVVHHGIEDIEVGGAFARGTILTSDALGRAIGAGAGQWQIGRALKSSTGAAGERVPVLVIPNYY